MAATRDQRASVESAELRARLEAAEKALAAERAEVEPLRRRLEATELALAMVGTTQPSYNFVSTNSIILTLS